MEAHDIRFTRIITEGSKQFIVPVFQRDYRWEENQWNQLWSDIQRGGSRVANDEHFLGSIVSIELGRSTSVFNRWLVIDGQQRLATLTLLLVALRDHIRDTAWSGGEDSPTCAIIDNQFLKNPDEQGERHYKLQLRRADNAQLRALVDGKKLDAIESNSSERIESAYNYFRRMLNQLEVDIDAVWQGIVNLKIVDVTLGEKDNPQLVFESLNSTGVGLSQSDLIRNYLLMRLDEKEQTRLYNEYWSQIEILLKRNDQDLNAFLQNYIALMKQDTKIAKDNQIYDEFKLCAPSLYKEDTLEERLKDMRRFAEYYAKFRGYSDEPSRQLVDAMRYVRWRSSAPSLLIMRLYDYYDREVLKEKEFVQALRFLESYLCRRAVIGLRNNSYREIFARIAHQLIEDSPYQSLLLALSTLGHNYGFPSDEWFRQELQSLNLYHKTPLCKNLLDRLENDGEREPSPTDDYTIEHIMPQGLTKKWRNMLGDNWEQIHEDWLHRLGNLTLTGYNNEYSNSEFEKKKTIPRGFNWSAVRLNKYVREQDEWTLVQIEKRGRILSNRALKIWQYPHPDEAFVEMSRVRELRIRESQKNTDDLDLSDDLKSLINALDSEIRVIDKGIIAPIERNSICYYNPEFFLEVLPASWRLRLLLNISIADLNDPQGIAQDSTWRDYVQNATNNHPYGVEVELKKEDQIESVLPLIHQAYEQVDN